MLFLENMPRLSGIYMKMLCFACIGCLLFGMTMAQSTTTIPGNCEAADCVPCLNSSGSAATAAAGRVFIVCNQTCHCVNDTWSVSNRSGICSEVDPVDIRNATTVEQCNIVFTPSPNVTPDISTNSSEISTETPTTPAVPVTTPTTNATTSTEATTNATTLSTTTQAPPPTTESTSSTASPTSSKTTDDTTHVYTTSPSVPEGRHFDGASFIGGIILALGLMAISYVGFKFYRSRTENNYHTLREAIHM